MSILKLPYEISLWDDDLFWRKQRLKEVAVSESTYKPGQYYSNNFVEGPNSGQAGVKTYSLDTGDWVRDRKYYVLKDDSDDDYIQGSVEDNITTDPTTHKDWYEFFLTKDLKQDGRKSYYQKYGENWVRASGLFDPATWYEASILPVTIIQYYKENKLCVIGSNTMSSPARATDGKLVSNVNGSNTFTFNMYSRYYDEDLGEFCDNPYLDLLVNERKIKLRHGELGSPECKWYDFVIKDVKKNSENKTVSYTCKDLFINELSKSGFDLELDVELANNMGTITQLANEVLKGSDWGLGGNNDTLTQYKEEPLYKIKLNQNIDAIDMTDPLATIHIGADEEIYVFYSVIANQDKYFQFTYLPDGSYECDDDRVIINAPNYYFSEDMRYDGDTPFIAWSMDISEEYRGKRLVRQPQTVYDPIAKKYVGVYKKLKAIEGDEYEDGTYYGYTERESVSPTMITSYITNGSGFKSTSGWQGGSVWVDAAGEEIEDETFSDSVQNIEYSQAILCGFPDLRDVENWLQLDNYRSFIKYNRAYQGQYLCNSGFRDHRSSLEGLAKDQSFVLRAKVYLGAIDLDTERISDIVPIYPTQNINVTVAEFEMNYGRYILKEKYFEGTITGTGEDGWLFATDKSGGTVLKSLVDKSKAEITNAQVGIFFETPIGLDLYFEAVEFYPYIQYERPLESDPTKYEMVDAEPGGELFSLTKTRYIYYKEDKTLKSADEIKLLYSQYEDNPLFVRQYTENPYEKVRSITAKESNRFNIIQQLCEIFECWAEFVIEHNSTTGEILLDDTWRQQKSVQFREYIGKENHAGFKYGVNLKSIQRTLNSDSIVSKLIVKNNSNEFAKNGFCSIARSEENATKENALYNFDYYIQHDLVEFSEITNDLYLETNGYIGYYKKLKRLNADRERLIEERAQLAVDISHYESSYTTYNNSVMAAQEELVETETAIFQRTGHYAQELCSIYNVAIEKSEDERSEVETNVVAWWDRSELISLVNKIAYLNALIIEHGTLRDLELLVDGEGKHIGGRWHEAEQQLKLVDEKLENLSNKKLALNLQFYKKYSRFIQEGSWISEDYVDDNLYYLDAESTLYTSAQPKVTYTINVLELSRLEGYENYHFALGDKTYVEDTEFFGWAWKGEDKIRTPYHEEVVISEASYELDSPEKNTFKVQNFKTQFEDLFQRIAATTQSVTYHSGEYERAAGIIDSQGNIQVDILQNSFENNAIRLENARDQSVVWDEYGITTTSLANPLEMVRIVSGGIFLSVDGGTTWSTGVTGTGLNASMLRTGIIDADKIQILNGNFPSFRWDGNGISAFAFKINPSTGTAYNFSSSKFVRYDQYGLYGINGKPNFIPTNEEDVWNEAMFALTWKGFKLKRTGNDGYVSIDSERDFVVHTGGHDRIQIGEIDTGIYGIRVSDAGGDPILETNGVGELWLKKQLRIGNDRSCDVEIGYLDRYRKDAQGNDTDIREVFHAGHDAAVEGEVSHNFIVYEDGRMKAMGAEFHGDIYATGGKIGNMTIQSVQDAVGGMNEVAEAVKKLDIEAKFGYNFNVDNDVPSPSALSFEVTGTGLNLSENTQICWQISKDFQTWVDITNATGMTLSLPYDFFKLHSLNNTLYLRATLVEDAKYKSDKTIFALNNGKKGDDAIAVYIYSSKGDTFRNNRGSTTLIAKVFRGSEGEVDQAGREYTYTWSDPQDPAWEPETQGKSITVTADEINFSRTYICTVSKGGQ